MKKLLLTIGTATAVIAPVAAVVACGKKDDEEDYADPIEYTEHARDVTANDQDFINQTTSPKNGSLVYLRDQVAQVSSEGSTEREIYFPIAAKAMNYGTDMPETASAFMIPLTGKIAQNFTPSVDLTTKLTFPNTKVIVGKIDSKKDSLDLTGAASATIKALTTGQIVIEFDLANETITQKAFADATNKDEFLNTAFGFKITGNEFLVAIDKLIEEIKA